MCLCTSAEGPTVALFRRITWMNRSHGLLSPSPLVLASETWAEATAASTNKGYHLPGGMYV